MVFTLLYKRLGEKVLVEREGRNARTQESGTKTQSEWRAGIGRKGVSECIYRVGQGRRTKIRERLFVLPDCW